MFGIGMPELIIILVIILVIFGAGKLPDIENSMGKAIKGFKTAVDDSEKEHKLLRRKISRTRKSELR